MSAGGKCLLRCNADLDIRKLGPRKEIDRLHLEMCRGVHISHIVSCPSQGHSGGVDKFLTEVLKRSAELENI